MLLKLKIRNLVVVNFSLKTYNMQQLLITGANGFLGRNIQPLLQKSGYTVSTLDIANANVNSNLAKAIPCLKEPYDIILHAAGKAHFIPRTKAEENIFFDINYQGTINLCKGLEISGLPRSFVFISTVAVYGVETGENITEEFPLNGHTPYALSKIQAEQFLMDWSKKNNVILSILRPSLIAGPNPPGNLGDMITGVESGRYLSIAGGVAKKSVLMVQDIAVLIPLLAEKGGIYNVCDEKQLSLAQLANIIALQLNKKQPFNIPYWVAKAFASIGDLLGRKAPINSLKLRKITESLTFSSEKIRRELNWQPSNVADNFKIK